MDSKTICIQQITHLSTATIMGRQAPHKAVLLLAIMDLIENGTLTTPKLILSKQLEIAFETEWQSFVGSPLVFKCKIATPFWHMRNEPFYDLYFNDGKLVTTIKSPYSIKKLREETYAIIDPDLFALMSKRDNRIEFRTKLIDTYLKGLHSDLIR